MFSYILFQSLALSFPAEIMPYENLTFLQIKKITRPKKLRGFNYLNTTCLLRQRLERC